MLASVAEVENLESQGNVKDFFKTISTNVDTYKVFISRELIGFRRYLVDVENYKCPLFWWCK
jgi:hypothetical protein